MAPDNDLSRWIGDLSGHLQRGALMELPPFELGHGTWRLAGETTIRIMFSDLADLNAPSGSAASDPVWRQERLCRLYHDFRRLRELLD